MKALGRQWSITAEHLPLGRAQMGKPQNLSQALLPTSYVALR